MSESEKAIQLLDTVLGQYETLGSVPIDWYDKVKVARQLLGDSLGIAEPPAIGVSVNDTIKTTERFG